MELDDLRAARAGDDRAFARLVEPFRRELKAHCYRMAGSLHDADDLLQESLLKAWRGLTAFEERAGLRTWLYRITTNVCLDSLRERPGRTLPSELGPPADPTRAMAPPALDAPWLEPCPETLYADVPASPEARYGQRESVAFAFLVALQLLPAKQRAVLILHDVVGMPAVECAELLELSVAAVNSALQRARSTLESKAGTSPALSPSDSGLRTLLARYVEAWERADVGALVSLLHEDATLAMPPFAEWLLGRRAIGEAIDAMVFAAQGPGGIRLIETRANGLPAFAAYFREKGTSGALVPRGVHVLSIRGDRIEAITAFLSAALLEQFAVSPPS